MLQRKGTLKEDGSWFLVPEGAALSEPRLSTEEINDDKPSRAFTPLTESTKP